MKLDFRKTLIYNIIISFIISDICRTGELMLIESIELDNFKSFGNKKKILFKKGLTVISGPNGSGKSNIGDSLLFVLGVRSSRTIRAERLSDLIHKSSSTQRQRNYCRVSLVIDTEKENVPEENRKIKLTRELVLENGEYRSNFFINGTRSRRSDVEQILDTSQIYLDSYSVVLQGDINNLIEMSGNERRKLIESIAGIESYNNQIEKAKTDIRGLVVNLEKIDILRNDHRSRLEQLHVEKEQAEHYNTLTGEIRDLRATILSRQLAGHIREQESIVRQVEVINTEIQHLNEQRESLKQQIQNLREEISRQQELRDRSSTKESVEVRKKIDDIRLAVGEKNLQEQSLEREKDRLDLELSQNAESVSSWNTELRQLSESVASMETELQGKQTTKSELDEKFSTLLSTAGNSSRQISELQEKLREWDSRIRELRGEEQAVSSEIGGYESRKNGILQSLTLLEEKQKNIEQEVKDSKWRLKESEDGSQQTRNERQKLTDRYYKLRTLLSDLNTERQGLAKRQSEVGREYERLNASYNIRSQNVSKPLACISAARSRGEVSGIHGTVRELIAYDEKFAMAVEAAAGGRLNSLVVESDMVAEKCLNILKREKAGKMTFLPLNKMATARPRGKAIMVKNSGESLGYIFENVRLDKEYENVAWYCFQDTLIMPDVPTARKHMGGIRLVTLEGDIFEASGAITGGFLEKNKSAQVGEARIKELSAEMASIEARLSEIDHDLASFNSEYNEISEKMQETSRNEGTDQGKLASYRETIKKGEAALIECRKSIETEKTKLLDIEQKLREIGEKEGAIVDRISAEEKEKETLFEKMREFSPEIVDEKNRVETELNALRDSISSSASELEKKKIRLDYLRSNIEDGKKKETAGRKRLSEIEGSRNQLKEEIVVLRDELAKYTLLENSINEQLGEISRKIAELEKKVSGKSAELDSTGSAIVSKNEIASDFDVKKRVLTDRIAETESQIAALGGATIITTMSLQELKSSVTSKENEITSMGPVNQKAIEEYQQEKDYLAGLDLETEKLKKEKAELESLEESLTEQKKVVFLKLFKDINLNMNSIYYALSEGGEAMLVLSDENNPLESEVHIRAKPKGNNFNKIDALSGGEKSLTAMAFIMAVQRINPSPIYYLDEVDMFLDGSNAERIGKMLKENSKTSQVLIVSLRKAMLKYADQIIGVTTFDDENTDIFVKSFSEVEK